MNSLCKMIWKDKKRFRLILNCFEQQHLNYHLNMMIMRKLIMDWLMKIMLVKHSMQLANYDIELWLNEPEMTLKKNWSYFNNREIKLDVTWSYVKRQTAKMTSEFVFFSSNPSLNHIKIKKCLLLFATNTNIFTLLFKELKADGKSFIFAVCRLT